MKTNKIRNNKKKGFTLVELIIVIAVIAILTAILVPTFVGVIRKARISADTQIARNMNTALTLAEVTDGKNKTLHDAVQDIKEAGYLIDKLTPSANGCSLVWDQKTDRIMYFDEEGKVMYAEDMDAAKEAVKDINKHALWKVVHEESDMIGGFSYYLADDFNVTTNPMEITTGLDVGTLTVNEIIYKPAAATTQNVIIRTNGGTLTVNAPLDTVTHYGILDTVNIIAVFSASYHEVGIVRGNMTVESGNVVIEKSSEVNVIIIDEKSTGNNSELKPTVLMKSGSKLNTIVANTIDTEINIEASSNAPEILPGKEAVKNKMLEAGSSIVEGATPSTDVIFNTDEAKDFAGGLGTEKSPYIISSIEHWLNFRNKGFASENKYWSVTADLDFSDTEEAVEINKFAGTIDFNGNKVEGITLNNVENTYSEVYSALFYSTLTKRTAIIKNLDFYTPTIALDKAIFVVYEAEGDTTLESVSVYGNVVFADNNASIFIGVARNSVTFEGCTNYANISNQSGYVAAFLGTVMVEHSEGAVKPYITFKNCINKGTIMGLTSNSSAAMLLANTYTIFKVSAMPIDHFTIENCKNEGVILAKKSGLFCVPVTNVLTQAVISNCENGQITSVSGGLATITSATVNATQGETINFGDTEINDAARYILSISYFGKAYKADGTLDTWGTFNYTIESNNISELNEIYAYNFINYKDVVNKDDIVKVGDTDLYTVTQEGVTYYVFNKVNEKGNYYISEVQPSMNFMAFDEQNNLISYKTIIIN